MTNSDYAIGHFIVLIEKYHKEAWGEKMSYKVTSSEKLRKCGAETETKAMLYLMNFHEDRDEIHFFVVDFFNDLTGVDRIARNMWDLQSKGAKTASPKEIGKELVTLYKNYISDFEFKTYILFMENVSSTFRVDGTKNVFDISNVTGSSKGKLIEGLKEEGRKKTYIPNSELIDSKINDFLDKVEFVVDDKEATDYIKAIIGNHPRLIPENDVLAAIFNEIRAKQSTKKESYVVENLVIDRVDEALTYGRQLTKSEIKMLALQRVLNWNFLDKGIPDPFIPIYNTFPPEQRTDIKIQCQGACCKALFNNNCSEGYWRFFEFTYFEIENNPNEDVNAIYAKIPSDILLACPDLDAVSFKYFISIIKGGLKRLLNVEI